MLLFLLSQASGRKDTHLGDDIKDVHAGDSQECVDDHTGIEFGLGLFVGMGCRFILGAERFGQCSFAGQRPQTVASLAIQCLQCEQTS